MSKGNLIDCLNFDGQIQSKRKELTSKLREQKAFHFMGYKEFGAQVWY